MPQPEDYLAAYVLLLMVAILGCGAAVIALIAAIDHFVTQHKRAVLRRRRG
ncbi:hypothetical protein SEA_HOTFRIES_47 [Streptomyces phage HotFries]|nr:hypothetical protein SEA_HOTFRIES_47 [Streptomyces phage HotFries]